ncbi:MAG: hypothetical protein U0636_09170 [Phycisphaerales bacterium]
MTRIHTITSLAAALCVAAAATASSTTATYLGTNGVEGLGSYNAVVTYDYSGGSSAILTVFLSNTTSASTGGYITALALTAAGASSVSLSSSTSAAFNGLNGPVEANPFGNFVGGASTSDSWLGGGSPTNGISVGNSATFVFNLTGLASNLASVTADTVLQATGNNGLVVRFRGMANGGSDKVIAYVVPAPAGLAVLGLLAAPRARRRRA